MATRIRLRDGYVKQRKPSRSESSFKNSHKPKRDAWPEIRSDTAHQKQYDDDDEDDADDADASVSVTVTISAKAAAEAAEEEDNEEDNEYQTDRHAVVSFGGGVRLIISYHLENILPPTPHPLMGINIGPCGNGLLFLC